MLTVSNERTRLETPGLVGQAACCSFSKRPLFLDTSSSRNRVLWVTSGDRIISDFYMHRGSRVKTKNISNRVTK